MKRFPAYFLKLLAAAPILFFSNSSQVLSTLVKPLPADALHDTVSQSTRRAIAARETAPPYPDALLKMACPEGGNGGGGGAQLAHRDLVNRLNIQG